MWSESEAIYRKILLYILLKRQNPSYIDNDQIIRSEILIVIRFYWAKQIEILFCSLLDFELKFDVILRKRKSLLTSNSSLKQTNVN